MNTMLRHKNARALQNLVSGVGLALLICVGCGSQTGVSGDDAVDTAATPDTDTADTGPADTGPADTGPADTGPADTGPADTGPADTGPADTAPADIQQPDVQTTDTGPDVAVDAPDVATTCTCGDQNCNAACGETLATCPLDCAKCPDGICSPGESPKTCSQDCCGSCGDGKCVGYECGENPTTCAQDCLWPCGNGICEKGENPGNCAADCKKQVCGNGVCEPEDGGPKTCPQDCGTTCGNCICEKGEDFTGCPVDCGFCGDGVCSQCAGLAESATTCTADCKANCFAKGCDDGVACTTDLCGSDGNCAHVPNMAACNDNNACTDDACVLGTGCVQTPNFSSCNDGDACTTNDGCADSKCAGIAKNCDDNNPCSTDSCTPGTGACAHVSVAGPCEDGDACTVGDACSAGKCLPGDVTDCNDQDDCTADTCDTFAGCQHTPVACKACTPDEACAPTNLCHLGTTTCVNKKPVCNDTGDPAPDDTPCGTGKGCVAGSCKSFSNFTSVVTGGGQTGVVDGVVLPVVIKVVDLGNAPVADATVTITAPTGAAAVPGTGKTNGQGKFTFSPRLGRATGDYVYTIKVQLAAPIPLTATAKAADPGIVYTLVNADHSNGNDGKPGPATTAHTSFLGDMTRASDGTLYVADSVNHQILKVTPAGEVSVIAGTTQGSSGDNGPAIQAKFSYPGGVALDEPNGQLYIADTQNNLIRVIDLASGIISSFGGEGSAPSPGYGDSGPANAAVFSQP